MKKQINMSRKPPDGETPSRLHPTKTALKGVERVMGGAPAVLWLLG